jgi:hypothetical protein
LERRLRRVFVLTDVGTLFRRPGKLNLFLDC